MIKFKNFILNTGLLFEAKIDDFTNRYLNYHKDHPTVVANPEEAKKLVGHAHQFAQGHDESIFLTKQLLDKTYNPGEDDETIKSTLGKWRKAKTQGLVGGKLSDHSHESVSALFRDIPQLGMQKRQANALSGMEKYRIGQIEHPEHGTLDVYNVRNKEVKDDKEYENISANLRKTCSGSNWCVLPSDRGPTHLKHYSHGHGIFFYVNKEGTPVLSHGFGDRGIVRPDNSVIQKEESDDIKKKTSSLLSGTKKEAYDLLSGNPSELPADRQMKVYEEFGDAHSLAHFLDPKTKTHPQVISRIIKDITTLPKSGGRDSDVAAKMRHAIHYLTKHPSMSEEHTEEVQKQYELDTKQLASGNLKQNTSERDAVSYRYERLHDILGDAIRNGKVNKKIIEKAVTSHSPQIRNIAFTNSRHIDDSMIRKGMDDIESAVRNSAVSNNYYHMSPETVEKAVRHSDVHVNAAVLKSPKITVEQINHLMRKAVLDYDSNDRELLIPHIRKKVQTTDNADILDHALKYPAQYVSDVLDNEHINEGHLQKIMSSQHVAQYMRDRASMAKAMSANYDPDHLNGLLTNVADKSGKFANDTHLLAYYARNPHLSDQEFKDLHQYSKTNRNGGTYPNPDGSHHNHPLGHRIIGNLLKNKNVPASIVNEVATESEFPGHLVSPRSIDHVHMALRHPKLTARNIHKLINRYNEHLNHAKQRGEIFIGDAAITHAKAKALASNPSLNGEHLSEILRSHHLTDDTKNGSSRLGERHGFSGSEVGAIAFNTVASKKQLTSDHIHTVLDLPDPTPDTTTGNHPINSIKTRILVDNSPDSKIELQPDHLEQIKNHPNPAVREFYAAKNPNSTSDELHEALRKTKNPLNGYAILTHPNAKQHHIEAGLRHPNQDVAGFARMVNDFNETKQKEKKQQQVTESFKSCIIKILIS